MIKTPEKFEKQMVLLQARRDENEMKMKPATNFKLLTLFIHKKKKKKKKKKKITSLGEERANLSAFRTFVLVWICWFPLPLGVWEGLRFVIVALPGLFSYLFYCNFSKLKRIAAIRLNNLFKPR